MSTWGALGFSASPYDVQPLKANEKHVQLLVGRVDEGIQFCTFVDSASEGVFVISGAPGVGKTSFFNIYQYLLETGQAPCGPKLMAARCLCPVQADDTARTVAHRILQTLLKNVNLYCAQAGQAVPAQVAKLLDWVGDKSDLPWDFEIEELGYADSSARPIRMPAISDATFENFQDAIAVVVCDAVKILGRSGVFIVLDNVENLEDERLAELLMSFRDTLFSVANVWWIIIGQSGLYSLIQALDTRISDRIVGSGLELQPISIDELSLAVDQRVEKLHDKKSGKAPLSKVVHRKLYAASFGEIRFVFKYCNTICLGVVASLRKEMLAKRLPVSDEELNKAIGKLLTRSHIPDQLALGGLRDVVSSEFGGLGLKPRECKLLREIGERGSARSREFQDFGFASAQEFSSKYLTRLASQGLLVMSRQGRASIYKLRGMAILAKEFNLLF